MAHTLGRLAYPIISVTRRWRQEGQKFSRPWWHRQHRGSLSYIELCPNERESNKPVNHFKAYPFPHFSQDLPSTIPFPSPIQSSSEVRRLLTLFEFCTCPGYRSLKIKYIIYKYFLLFHLLLYFFFNSADDVLWWTDVFHSGTVESICSFVVFAYGIVVNRPLANPIARMPFLFLELKIVGDAGFRQAVQIWDGSLTSHVWVNSCPCTICWRDFLSPLRVLAHLSKTTRA